MTEAQPAPNSDPGRWIRFALVMLPVGTIILGIASFGIWQWKKDQAADRSFKYAQALRRTISAEGIERHVGILRTALSKEDRDLSIPGYLQSTMGAENMGYNVRRERFGSEQSVIDAELTGTKRPMEVVMVLVPYGGAPERAESTAQAIAESLSIAHEITGEKVVRSLRFAFIPDTPAAVEELSKLLKRDGERLMHLFVLGGPETEGIATISRVLETTTKGTRVISQPASGTAQDTLQAAYTLKAMLLDAAELP
ncbi:hypothetical protein [Prosthecobacter sp.]|uniref:hypothetical protein n=1 Tax=Prosthecobacter sp. TaxID=1965333 RepID=UPI003782D67E